MKDKKYKIPFFFQLLATFSFYFFVKIFNITAKVPKNVKNLKGPYLLLSNHVGYWDPFVISYFLKKKPHFVVSDATLRNPIIRFLLKNFGVISKKKNIKDSKVIRQMIEYAKHNEAIGLFPEGTRTWTGDSLAIEPATSKLVKILNIPVVTANMKGMYLSNPRWAYNIRKARVQIDFKLMVNSNDIKEFSLDKIDNLITNHLWHNEIEYQKKEKIKIRSEKRAEFLNHVIFHCPKCNSLKGFSAKKNNLNCKNCNLNIFVNSYGFFETNNFQLPYNDIIQAYEQQVSILTNYINNEIKAKNKNHLFFDKDVLIYKSNENEDYTLIGKADLYFHIEKIEIKFHNKKYLFFDLDKIQTLNPQVNERIELYYQDKAYRFIGEKPGLSGVKWEIACNTIWYHKMQMNKLSTHLKLLQFPND